MLTACVFSCTNPNKPLTSAERSKIIYDVNEVVKQMNKAAESVNFELAMQSCLDSPDFTYTSNGNSLSYKEFFEAMKPIAAALKSQKCTPILERFAVLDRYTVMYTVSAKWLMNFKDGHSVAQDPYVGQFLFRKIDDRWRIVSCNESSVDRAVPGEGAKDLDQAELHKQFAGNWKCTSTRDTTAYWDCKAYGTGLDCMARYVTRGNTVLEARQLWGYNKTLDRGLMAEMIKGTDIGIYGSCFTSKTKGIIVPRKDLFNPQNASIRWEFEFKSPDSYDLTNYIDDKLVKTEVWTRVK